MYSCEIEAINSFSGYATIHCLYYYRELDPVTGKYIYQRSGYVDYDVFVEEIEARSIEISPTQIELNYGETYRMEVSVFPSNANQNITWSSSNRSVAYVNSSNILGANGYGTCTVTATTNNGLTASCAVTVKKIEPTSISIPRTLDVYVEETGQLNATLYPSNAMSTLTWYSKDEHVATVSSGRVTGVDEGSTVIYAKTANGLTSNNCNVKVYYRKPTAVSVDQKSLTLPVGGYEQLKYSFTPSHAKAEVDWSSSNPSVVSVSSNGSIRALKVGEASIMVKTDNGYTATCDVKILPLPVQLSLPETLTLSTVDSYQLDVHAYPSDSYLALEWTSSDESIVTVSPDGEVTGKGVGNAVVTATASNGVSISCHVEVTEPAYYLNLWLHDGGTFSYPFCQHPIICINEEVNIVKTRTESIEYKNADIRKYTLSKTVPVVGEYSEITSVKDVMEEKSNLRMEQNSFVLSQCEADMPVQLYLPNGQMVGIYKTDSNGYLAIPTDWLSNGIYIIKSRSITCKIVKK